MKRRRSLPDLLAIERSSAESLPDLLAIERASAKARAKCARRMVLPMLAGGASEKSTSGIPSRSSLPDLVVHQSKKIAKKHSLPKLPDLALCRGTGLSTAVGFTSGNRTDERHTVVLSTGVEVDVSQSFCDLHNPAVLQKKLPPWMVAISHDADRVEPEDVAEHFCPPRLLPHCQKHGLTGKQSIDQLLGHDLMLRKVQEMCARHLVRAQVQYLLTCPPCTLFSSLMASNWTRMSLARKMSRVREGFELFQFAYYTCHLQRLGGRSYVLEHPCRSQGFVQDAIKSLQEPPNPGKVAVFDQCMFGLVSPRGLPVQKRTRLVTNCKNIFERFHGVYCNGAHEHDVCHGSQLGQRVSVHCQRYPPLMMVAIAHAIANDRASANRASRGS